ncbi:MAG: hypothetical protein C4294_14240, partial [Nitrospiraceae bacterium]
MICCHPSPQRRFFLYESAGCLAVIFAVLFFYGCSNPVSAVAHQTLVVTTDLAKRLRGHVEFLASPELKGRKPGTPGNRAAADYDYIIARFREAGLEPLPSLNGYGQTISPLLGDNLIGARSAAVSGWG